MTCSSMLIDRPPLNTPRSVSPTRAHVHNPLPQLPATAPASHRASSLAAAGLCPFVPQQPSLEGARAAETVETVAAAQMGGERSMASELSRISQGLIVLIVVESADSEGSAFKSYSSMNMVSWPCNVQCGDMGCCALSIDCCFIVLLFAPASSIAAVRPQPQYITPSPQKGQKKAFGSVYSLGITGETACMNPFCPRWFPTSIRMCVCRPAVIKDLCPVYVGRVFLKPRCHLAAYILHRFPDAVVALTKGQGTIDNNVSRQRRGQGACLCTPLLSCFPSFSLSPCSLQSVAAFRC
jgi:hypothetical protein